jgi:hypothetical protein
VRVSLSTILDCPATLAWSEVNKSAVLLRIASPLLQIRPSAGERLPASWQEGETYFVQCRILNVLPLGLHRLSFTKVDGNRLERESRESNSLVRSWAHNVSVRFVNRNTCLYCDDIEIEAGALTALVAAFARVFYRYRQWRLRRLLGRSG